MRPAVVEQLLSLNAEFYQTFARPFSQTRLRLQPGVRRLLPRLLEQESLLDLGSGNGELARTLALSGFGGHYSGLDFSPGLVAEAQRGLPANFDGVFVQANLSDPGWKELLPRSRYAVALAFATLHHLPGEALRSGLVEQVRGLLEAGGLFIHSNWQFLRSERLQARIQPWSRVGLDEGDVEPGDFLLDWRQGGTGLRYVHHFGEAELAQLAEQSGFRVQETFYADGKSGELGLYMVWRSA
jgi:tRNA (uracil-5-)-methyltransferase TRM9